MDEITVVGPGRLGRGLALVLSRSGFTIDKVIYRSRTGARFLATQINPAPDIVRITNAGSIGSSIVLITVQDEEIPNVVRSLENHFENVKAVFHTSGSLSSDILAPLSSAHCAVASLHPLVSISNRADSAERFKGAFFCLEGDQRAIRMGRRLVSKIGGRAFTIQSEQKSLYHAAALTAAGHVTALFDVAVSFMTKTGVDRRMARSLLQPLLSSVAENLRNEDTVRALTGTYARADKGTMDRHLLALRSNAAKDESMIYVELALKSILLAEKAGGDLSKLKKMRKSLMVAKRSFE